MKNKYMSFCLFLMVVVLMACNRKKTPDSCQGAICTAEFRMHTVYLKDSTGADFIPDKVETYNDNAQLILFQTAAAVPGMNVYTVVDDSNLDDLGVNITNELTFKIIKNNVVVKEAIYQAKADCCHISQVSGADTLIVN
ncbi:MAG: hypothetical protein IPI22_06085 [Bacteroidetes bacterium]|jgi:hypothetical protein|nr:hypothetical protein [Bacteroidota bacterium]HQW47209.1 hypothetical protein [Chitinophagaceae bacterium]